VEWPYEALLPTRFGTTDRDLGAARVENEFPDRVVECLTSNVEYMAGDELPLRSARWRVRMVMQEGIERIDGQEQTVRDLDCVLVV
jgi:hypothetical protein